MPSIASSTSRGSAYRSSIAPAINARLGRSRCQPLYCRNCLLWLWGYMSPLSRRSIAFAVLLVLLSLVPGIAAACSCVKEGDASTILRATDVILDGYVEKVEPADREGRFVATIRVLR